MYEALKERFAEVFGAAPTLLFSAPGRAELCGDRLQIDGRGAPGG